MDALPGRDLVSENNARAARADDRSETPLENADADAVRVKHDQHESVVFHAPNIPNIRLMRLTGRDAFGGGARGVRVAAVLDFGALDESQRWRRRPAGIAGRRARVYRRPFCFREPSFLQSARDDKKDASLAPRLACGSPSTALPRPARRLDDDAFGNRRGRPRTTQGRGRISSRFPRRPRSARRSARSRRSRPPRDDSARGRVGGAFVFLFLFCFCFFFGGEGVARGRSRGGDGFPRFRVTEPIAALAAVAREAASRDATPLDAPSDGARTPLAMAVCEAVAILAGASARETRVASREGVVAAFQSMARGAGPAVAAAAAAAAASLGAR